MRTVVRAIAAGWLACGTALATVVTVTPHEDRVGRPIPEDFLGISVETGAILKRGDGTRRFGPANTPLVNLYRTLGVHSLRAGGNQVDFPDVAIPTTDDIDSFFDFAKAAGTKVIYSFRLMPTPQQQDQDPAAAAAAAGYIAAHYAPLLDTFEIGNEPNNWPKPNKVTYEQFYPKWDRTAAAILRAVPDARLSGPGSAGMPPWFLQFAGDARRDFAGHFVQINQHQYFGGSAKAIKSPTTARARLVSPEITQDYRAMYDRFAPQCQRLGVGYRLEETNSLSRGGALQVSDTQASALWALNYLHWWADHDCQGINFHTGDWAINKPGDPAGNPYAVYWSTPGGKEYVAQPLAYGMKAFDLGGHGRRVPVTTSAATPALEAYAVLGDDHALCVTLINNGADELSVTLPAGSRRTGDAYLLVAPGNAMTAETGVTLGGSGIDGQGRWNGKPSPLTSPTGGNFAVAVPPASAAVVTLRP